MRDFFVRFLNLFIWLGFAFIVLASVISGFGVIFSGSLFGVLIIVGGTMAGFLFVGMGFLITGLYELNVGIYNNTAKTAEALELLAGIEQQQDQS